MNSPFGVADDAAVAGRVVEDCGGHAGGGVLVAVLANQRPQHFAADERAVRGQDEDVALLLAKVRLAHPGGVAGAELLGLLDPNDPLVALELRR